MGQVTYVMKAIPAHERQLQTGLPRLPRLLRSIETMTGSFAVPYALSREGRLTSAQNGIKEYEYRCPGCLYPLILRTGRTRRSHFAHKGSSSCAAESAVHKTAKLLIVQTITDWKTGCGPAPRIHRSCPKAKEHVINIAYLPSTIERAVEEVMVGQARRVDVGLMVGTEVAAAIEVLVSHPVDQVKGAEIGVPWIEVDGQAILGQPLDWKPTQDHFGPLRKCEPCAAEERAHEKELRQAAERARAVLKERSLFALKVAYDCRLRLGPAPPYSFGLRRCPRCSEFTPVAIWESKHSNPNAPPPEPRPILLRYVRSPCNGNAQWVNICFTCGETQSDYFLETSPDSPFFGIQEHYAAIHAYLEFVESKECVRER